VTGKVWNELRRRLGALDISSSARSLTGMPEQCDPKQSMKTIVAATAPNKQQQASGKQQLYLVHPLHLV